MSYPFLFFLLSLLFIPISLLGESRQISNPQALMVGARASALGSTNPAILGDLHSLSINPAILGDIDSMNIGFTNKKVLTFFDYTLLNAAFPIELRLPLKKDKMVSQRVSFGLSYGQVGLKGIPETTLFTDNNRSEVFATDRYSAGFRVLQLSAGTSFYNLYKLDKIALGVSAKNIQLFVDKDTDSSFAFDIGTTGTKYLDMYFIDQFTVGGTVHNLIAPAISISKTNNEALLPIDFFLGVKVDMFNETLSLLAHNSTTGFNIGGEYFLKNHVILRGSTDFDRVSFGTGILFDQVATGLFSRYYSLRLDYSYTQNTYPLDADPNHAVSVTILGESRPKQPHILFPEDEVTITSRTYLELRGVGPKNTTMRIYNNDSLTKTTLSNKFGNWASAYFPLKEGKNKIYIKSFSINKDISFKSSQVIIYSDTIPPSINIKVRPNQNSLDIFVNSDEELHALTATILDRTTKFKKIGGKKWLKNSSPHYPTQWSGNIKIPQESQDMSVAPKDLMVLSLQAQDMARNTLGPLEIPFFAAISFPQDKFVHYKDSLRVIGVSSPMVKTITVNGNPVYIDSNDRFSIPIPLKVGKNLVKSQVKTLTDDMITYTMRVLRLKTFPDLNAKVKGRREIEFLSTLKVLDGDDDGLFYPTKLVTRQYIAKLMVLSSDEEVPDSVEQSLFSDVPQDHLFAPYIKVAIDTGLMFAFPDGTFKPDQALTLSEAIFSLSNAGIIDYQEVEEEEGRYVTRSELAQFLAYTPQFELRIERLINWDKGY